jgi:hypothetical protein
LRDLVLRALNVYAGLQPACSLLRTQIDLNLIRTYNYARFVVPQNDENARWFDSAQMHVALTEVCDRLSRASLTRGQSFELGVARFGQGDLDIESVRATAFALPREDNDIFCMPLMTHLGDIES